MPYKSQAQAGYFHTHQKELAKQGVSVAEWDKASKGLSLPKRAKKKDGGLIKAKRPLSDKQKTSAVIRQMARNRGSSLLRKA